MSDAGSSHRRAQSAQESGTARPPVPLRGSSAQRPVLPDQPTYVSKHAPLQPALSVSDSAYRILQGKITEGDQLGHFQLVEYIGGGGMGRVFRAYDGRLARDVALKVLSPDQAADEETRLRFQNEAQSAARLDHENIARVFYVGEDHGLQYIVFEYIEGENLRDLVDRKGPLPFDEAISYTLQVIEALAHAAERAVVHRDIKPSNVLITPEGHVKLIDMGLARLRQVDAAMDLTASGVTLGTFDYISPEQARDPRDADVRSDIYSLGCTIFFILTGRPPFPNGTVLQKLLQHQADQPPDVREFRPDVPEELVRILRKMLAKDPRHRYQTPQPAVADLVQLAHRLGLHPTGPGKTVWVGTPRVRVPLWRRHLPWLVSVAALVAVVFALDMLWSLGGLQAEPERLGPATGRSKEIQNLAPPEETRPIDSTNASEAGAGQGTSDAASPLAKRDREVAAAATWAAAHGGTTVAGPLPSGVGTTAESVAPLQTSAGPLGLKPNGVGTEPARRPRLLIVDGVGQSGEHYAALSSACAAAADGDVIELRFDGPQEQPPVVLAQRRLSIRAGAGFRPTLVFRPATDARSASAPSMLAVSGGRLCLIGVDLQMALPDEPALRDAALIALGPMQALRCERCSLTVIPSSKAAPGEASPAVFRLMSGGAESADGKTPLRQGLPVRIDLTDSVVRGDAVLLDADENLPAQLHWQNGVFASDQPLLAVDLRSGDASDAVAVTLQHITAVARGGLCQIVQSAERSARAVELRVSDSVVVGTPAHAFVEHSGAESATMAQAQLVYVGDSNLFDGFEAFWRLRGERADATAPMTFAQWTSFWSSAQENSHFDAIPWARRADLTRPTHLIAADELALDPAADAVTVGGDGRAPGVDLRTLPATAR